MMTDAEFCKENRLTADDLAAIDQNPKTAAFTYFNVDCGDDFLWETKKVAVSLSTLREQDEQDRETRRQANLRRYIAQGFAFESEASESQTGEEAQDEWAAFFGGACPTESGIVPRDFTR